MISDESEESDENRAIMTLYNQGVWDDCGGKQKLKLEDCNVAMEMQKKLTEY